MLKQKVIIWGTGQGYRKREDIIKSKYDIVAYTDNSGKNGGFTNYIKPNDIVNLQYDYILICSKPYYLTIKYQLMNIFHINQEKIIGIEGIEETIALESEQIIFSHIEKYANLNTRKEFDIRNENMWLISSDYSAAASKPKEHYFAQDIWAAKKIINGHAEAHYDVGSRVDGFLGHLLASGKDVHYIDIRPLPYEIPGLHFMQGDATNLESMADESIESLSSLHAIEHFGLGRYGDLIDPEACFKAMRAFQRVLKKGGKLYLGVPIGPQNSVVFNAHRIFSPMTIISNFGQMELEEFSYVAGCSTVKVATKNREDVTMKLANYSCGLFEFIKKE